MPSASPQYHLTQLEELEAEAIFVLGEVVAECERPVLLFSGGKDSAVLLHLAAKAFRPAGLPFPILHVDTGRNFAEVLEFRDRTAARVGGRLLVASVQEALDAGRLVERAGGDRNRLQIPVLLEAIASHGFDAAIGGARRDEEKARAKERFFSFRDEFGQWDPKAQRPEVWSLYNARVHPGEHLRAFPLSNWTELDVWRYVATEEIELPSLYFAHRRAVVERDGWLFAVGPHLAPRPGETVVERRVRYRTVGDATGTAAVISSATTPEAIVEELLASDVSERGATRADDRVGETSMEDRKREGYF